MRSIQRSVNKRWPNSEVPYLIDAIFSPAAREVIASVSNIHSVLSSQLLFISNKYDCFLSKGGQQYRGQHLYQVSS